jgi:hypothetical protein
VEEEEEEEEWEERKEETLFQHQLNFFKVHQIIEVLLFFLPESLPTQKQTKRHSPSFSLYLSWEEKEKEEMGRKKE